MGDPVALPTNPQVIGFSPAAWAFVCTQDYPVETNALRQAASLEGEKVWARRWKLGRLADEALISLYDHEVARVRMSLDSSRDLSEMEDSSRHGDLVLEATQAEIDQMQESSTEATGRLIRLFQHQHQRRLNVLVAVSASVVGGVIGGVFALLVT
ncbi:MAG: hypothetical protein V3S26_03440 [Acidimicrobiia bacterium]